MDTVFGLSAEVLDIIKRASVYTAMHDGGKKRPEAYFGRRDLPLILFPPSPSDNDIKCQFKRTE